MGATTKISWCDSTWSPVGPRWTGRVELIEPQLEIPPRWKKPRRVFVSSISDTWHEDLPLRHIASIYAMMAICAQHTFLTLTKRPEQRKAAFASARFPEMVEERRDDWWDAFHFDDPPALVWPLKNVWEGVSIEDQATADERIPLLLQTPAAVRFISLEPMLGGMVFRPEWLEHYTNTVTGVLPPPLDWVVIGGETGPGARPCEIGCIRAVVEQCKAAGVPVWVKQLGSFWARRENKDPERWEQVDSRGADPAEWPEDLRVQQLPKVAHG